MGLMRKGTKHTPEAIAALREIRKQWWADIKAGIRVVNPRRERQQRPKKVRVIPPAIDVGALHLEPTRPWWSQPICPTCYEHIYRVPCKVRSPYTADLKCCVCEAPTADGIYDNITQKKHSAVEMAEWLREHPATDYARFMLSLRRRYG